MKIFLSILVFITIVFIVFWELTGFIEVINQRKKAKSKKMKSTVETTEEIKKGDD